jgi:hypothetical protein
VYEQKPNGMKGTVFTRLHEAIFGGLDAYFLFDDYQVVSIPAILCIVHVRILKIVSCICLAKI